MKCIHFWNKQITFLIIYSVYTVDHWFLTYIFYKTMSQTLLVTYTLITVHVTHIYIIY